jgi:nucleotide-binding universal stress UspA family protein
MKILIAVEDRVYGRALVEFVANHNWPANSQLKVLSVIEPLYWAAYGAPMAPDVMASMINQSQQYSQDLVTDVCEQLRKALPQVQVDGATAQGSPKDEILVAARDWPADIIVMGSHGRRGLQRVMLGSVSLAVLANAPCSVMVIRLTKEQIEKNKDIVMAASEKS